MADQPATAPIKPPTDYSALLNQQTTTSGGAATGVATGAPPTDYGALLNPVQKAAAEPPVLTPEGVPFDRLHPWATPLEHPFTGAHVDASGNLTLSGDVPDALSAPGAWRNAAAGFSADWADKGQAAFDAKFLGKDYQTQLAYYNKLTNDYAAAHPTAAKLMYGIGALGSTVAMGGAGDVLAGSEAAGTAGRLAGRVLSSPVGQGAIVGGAEGGARTDPNASWADTAGNVLSGAAYGAAAGKAADVAGRITGVFPRTPEEEAAAALKAQRTATTPLTVADVTGPASKAIPGISALAAAHALGIPLSESAPLALLLGGQHGGVGELSTAALNALRLARQRLFPRAAAPAAPELGLPIDDPTGGALAAARSATPPPPRPFWPPHPTVTPPVLAGDPGATLRYAAGLSERITAAEAAKEAARTAALRAATFPQRGRTMQLSFPGGYVGEPLALAGANDPRSQAYVTPLAKLIAGVLPSHLPGQVTP